MGAAEELPAATASPLLRETAGSPTSARLKSFIELEGAEEEVIIEIDTQDDRDVPVPRDDWNMAYSIFVLQGIGQLFPWNAFISATEYFGRRLCGTAYADNFENCFSVGYNLSGLAGLALAVRCQRLLRPRSRVLLPLALTALAFLVCFMLVLAPAVGGDALFLVTMVCIVASALAVAFLQSALFGLAGRFPPLYTQGMMAGQGIAGLVVALSSLLTTMAGPDATVCEDDDNGAAAVATIVTAATAEAAEGAAASSSSIANMADIVGRRSAAVGVLLANMRRRAAKSDFGCNEFGYGGLGQPAPPPGDWLAAEAAGATPLAFAVAATVGVGDDFECLPHDTVDGSTLAYFGIAFATLVLCAGAFIFLERLPVAIYYLGAAEASAESGGAGAGNGRLSASVHHHAGDSGSGSSSGFRNGDGGCSTHTEPRSRSPLIGGEDDAAQRSWAPSEALDAAGYSSSRSRRREGAVSSAVSAATAEAANDGRGAYGSALPRSNDGRGGINGDRFAVADGGGGMDRHENGRGASGAGSGGNGSGTGSGAGAASTLRALQVVLWQARSPAVAVFLVFAVTLSVFPGSTSKIASRRRCAAGAGRMSRDLFVPLSFVSFNAMDLAGRILAGSRSHVVPVGRLWLAAAARVVFVPLFLICAVAGSRLPTVFPADGFPVFFMVTFALSNGLLSSRAMMDGPGTVSVHDRELAGTAMVLSLNGGLLAGSLLSFLALYISTGSFD